MKTKLPISTIFAVLLLGGCATAPHEIVRLHEKEDKLIQEIRRSHLALIDAYIDERVKAFDSFYFSKYGPSFRKNWEAKFKEKRGRDYDPNKDFDLFHQDLIAEYQEQIRPIETIRVDLKKSVTTAHDQVSQAHAAVGDWIISVEKLNKTQRDAAENLLKAVNPSLSLDKVDDQIKKLEDNLSSKM